jgi:hypothetical protein
MAKFISFNVEAKGEKEFFAVLNEYAQWNKRQPLEIAVAKAYFIDLNAMSTTKAADKGKITQELESNAKNFSGVPLAAILVNKQLGKKGKKGLTGAKMIAAVQKYIKTATSRTQAARSGWLAGAKTLDFWNRRGDVSFSKRFAPKKPQGVKEYGQPKGNAKISNQSGKAWVSIANQFGKGKQDSRTITPILLEGLQKAIARELASMKDYITKKYQEQFNRMKRTKTI